MQLKCNIVSYSWYIPEQVFEDSKRSSSSNLSNGGQSRQTNNPSLSRALATQRSKPTPEPIQDREQAHDTPTGEHTRVRRQHRAPSSRIPRNRGESTTVERHGNPSRKATPVEREAPSFSHVNTKRPRKEHNGRAAWESYQEGHARGGDGSFVPRRRPEAVDKKHQHGNPRRMTVEINSSNSKIFKKLKTFK